MKHQAILGNIGHFDDEIEMAAPRADSGVRRINIKPQVDEFDLRRTATRSSCCPRAGC